MKRASEFRMAGANVLRLGILFLIARVVGIVAACSTRTEGAARGPRQPGAGPGSASYKHGLVVAQEYGVGPTRYWIFEPADPKPESAPVIVFNHGWLALEPKYYGAWIDHIVRRGNIVIFPVYQDGLRTHTSEFTANAAAGVRAGIARLKAEPGHVRPQLEMVAVVGHSMGGLITANFGAEWKRLGIPQPRALMCVEPGRTSAMPKSASVQLADLSLIGKDTLLLTVAGDRDRLVKDEDAKRIFKETTKVAPENKNHILMVSDDHGSPVLVANHLAPVGLNLRYTDPAAAGTLSHWFFEQMEKRRLRASENGGDGALGMAVDALDFYGTWKLFDGLSDAAFYGRNREYALGNTQQQRFMGKWSDGIGVKELQVSTIP